MAEMTKKDRVRAALNGGPVDHVPASLWGHDFLREWGAHDLVASTVEQYREHDWDFIKLNPRATYFAEAWGNTYERPKAQHQPRPVGAAVASADDFRGIRAVDPKEGVFGEHLRALGLLLDEVGDEVDVVQTIFSPLGVLAMLCGPPERFRDLAEADGEATHAALATVASTLTEYARASLDAGAAGIFYAPLIWASRDTCSGEFYREFGRPYDLQVLAGAQGAAFNIMHVCRNNNMLEMLLDYPVAAFNWADHGEGNPDLAAIKKRTDKAVMGGIDQARVHTMTADEVATLAANTIAHTGRERLFLTAGCAISPDTPDQNKAAVRDASRAAARV